MNNTSKLMAGVAGLAVLLALAWAFRPRAIEVEVAPVTQGRFEAGIDEDAKTRLRERHVVTAPLAGRLERIALREGDSVAVEAVLARLTPLLSPLLDARTLREQQLRVEGAQANVQRVEARIEGARLALQQARDDGLRSQQLARQGFVAPARLETDRLAELAARKALEAVEQERHVALHEVEQARAALAVVQQVGGAGRAFELRAPIAGRVMRVLQASEGTVALGTPLLELGDTAQMEVVAELLTSDALQAAPGSPVVIERWGGPGALQGRVRQVEPSAFTKVSALGVEEQRVKVLIDITSPAAQWLALGDGFRVAVHIVTRVEEGALKVPVSAVFPDPLRPGGMSVFVADGGRARQQAVELGARNGSEAWVRRGLAPGAQVIVYAPPAVVDGARVAVRGR